MSYALPSHLWVPQRRGLEQTMQHVLSGRDVCLFAPTGGGKTVVAGELLRWAASMGWGGIFFVNRKLLVGQTSERFEQMGLEHGVRAADYCDKYKPERPIQISSADTERARCYDRKTWKLHEAKLAIVDEAHIQKGKTMRRLLSDYKMMDAAIVLLTATPVGLSGFVDKLVISGSLQEYRDCKALVPARVFSVETPDMRKIKRNNVGEFIMDGEKKKIYVQSIVDNVIKRYKKHNPDQLPTMLYAPDVAGSVWLTERFEKAGFPWCHVDATDACLGGERYKLTRQLWDDIAGMYRDGEIRGISSRMKLREGIDFPETGMGILATPIGSLPSYIQTVGRILRYSERTPEEVVITDHGGCLDSETEVLTERGWIGREGIQDSDRVAAFNRETREISWEPILSRYDRPIQSCEQMFSVDSRCLNIRVTGNHRMAVKTRCSNYTWPEPFSLDRADSLTAGRYKIPLAGEMKFPGVPLTDDELRFLGIWITDGCLYTRANGTEVLSISQMEHQPWLEGIRSVLRGCDFEWKERKQKCRTGNLVSFNIPKGTCKIRPRKGWHRLGGYISKDLSPLLMQMSKRQFGIFLHWVHLGDGDKGRGDVSYRISKGNATAMERLQVMCILRGYKCNLRTSREGRLTTLNIVKTQEGTLHGPETVSNHKIATLSPCEFTAGERVWCLANRLETLVTRRRGKVAIVGNSYLRHGSPNQDRDWSLLWELPERIASTRRVSAITEGEEYEPIRCPRCGGERIAGRTCPHCGFEHGKSMRLVLMENGDLVEKEGDVMPRKRIRVKADTQELWGRMFWAFRRKGVKKSFAQMRGFFAYEHGYTPPKTLYYMPTIEAAWYTQVSLVPNDLIRWPS